MARTRYDELTVQRLVYFRRVAQFGSFRQAAADVRLTAPALTSQISALEKTLGFPLFERKQRGISLTPAGRQMLEQAERVIDRIDRLSEFASGLASGTAGTLTLACYPVHVERSLGKVVERFIAEFPQVRLDFTQMRDDRRRDSGRTLFDELHEGDVDIVMGPPPRHQAAQFASFEMYIARLVALLPVSDERRHMRTIPISELAEYPLLTAPAGYFSRTKLEEIAHASGQQLNVVATSSSPPALGTLGQAGLGIPVLPDDYPFVRAADPKYPVVVDMTGAEACTPVHLHWNAQSPTAATQGFVRLAREVRKSL